MNDQLSIEQQKEITALLAGIPFLAGACELDLLVFLYRHPRTLLTNDQLAALVGYDMKHVAEAIETFIQAGLLERTQNPMHAARMYLLLLEAPQTGGLKTILDLASTRQGRGDILRILGSERSTRTDSSQATRRLRFIA